MKIIVMIVVAVLFSSCSSSLLKYENEGRLDRNDEFDQQVKIQSGTMTSSPQPQDLKPEVNQDQMIAADIKSKNNPQSRRLKGKKTVQSGAISNHLTNTSTDLKKVNPKKSKNKNESSALKQNQTAVDQAHVRQPDIEDQEGFVNGARRPTKDPFRANEKIVHSVSYFGAEAGRLSLDVLPFVQVNDEKNYHFQIGLKSSRLFSSFYSVDNIVETFLNFEQLTPAVLKINVHETGKIIKAQSYFDHKNLKAHFWEKKVTEKSGEENKKLDWDILPYSQNAYSGLFYMRIFNWKVGKEISFRVAEDEKNIVFKGTAIAREKLDTEAGEFEAIKIKASIFSRGALTQTGDIYIWVSDDDRHYILRIEAKIKIGSLVSEVVEIHPGE